MELRGGAVGTIAALCVMAGAGGAYLLNGAHQPEVAASVESVPPTAPSAVPAPAPAPAPQVVVVERRVAPAPRATPRPPQREQATTWVPASAPVETESFVPQARPVDPLPAFVELTLPEDSVVGLQVETALTSERARIEDEVVAHVTRDVRVGDRVAIPSGATAYGQVVSVERGGRVKARARLGIRFTSVVLADGTRMPLRTETIYREGDAPGGESAAKIGGGAIGGAIIGGILGGTRGAVLGGSAGAGAGTAAVFAGGRNAATFPAGTPLTVRLVEPSTVTVEY